MNDIKEKLKTLLDTIPEDQLKDILNQLQPSTADKTKIGHDFLFETCQGMTVKITGTQEIDYFNKAGEWLFQQDYKKGKLYYSYNNIYLFLLNNYSVENIEINNFIQGWVATNLQWRGLTPKSEIFVG